jgi:hypothetical protein
LRFEVIVGMDLRPATRSLFVVTSQSRVLELDTNTGNLGLRGSFATPIAGVYGVDFNPTVDRIRVVNDGEQNYRLVPDTGALAATDTALAPAGSAVAAAYTNNVVGGGVTTLYVAAPARAPPGHPRGFPKRALRCTRFHAGSRNIRPAQSQVGVRGESVTGESPQCTFARQSSYWPPQCSSAHRPPKPSRWLPCARTTPSSSSTRPRRA